MTPRKPDPPSTEGLSSTQIVKVRPRPDQQLEPDAPPLLLVEVVGGPMDGVTARVENDELVLGRSPQCDLPLRLDPLVSTKHARIVREGSSHWLEDLDSRNGTWIGERRIEERTPIGPGTIFVAGNTLLEFLPG